MILILTSLLILQDRLPDRPLSGSAAKCGSEIPWLEDLEEAKRASKQSGKPILWWVTSVSGSPMDRKLVLQKYMLAGPWMMPDVVEILRRRFVPLRMASKDTLDVRPMKFIEPGFVVLDSQLHDLLRVDRMTFFQEDHFRNLLLQTLKTPMKPTDAEELFLGGDYEEALKRSPSPSLRARILRRLGREFRMEDLPLEERATAHLSRGDFAAADQELREATSDQGRYLRGAALHLSGKDDLGRELWEELVKEKPDSRWAWKAAAELARDGPFVRGFEVFAPPPKTIEIAHALGYLLSMQRGHGGWDDSNYNFGGEDSLPNVYVATTALIASALYEYRDADLRISTALERADGYLRDESHVAADDEDEIVWAYAYRLLYFAKIGDRKWMQLMIDSLAKMQARNGSFRHEYPNPFVTATVLHVLWEAKKAGAEVSGSMIRRAVDALKSCRNRSGVFSYKYPGRSAQIEGGAGRMPLCELGLFLWNAGTREALCTSVEASFKYHDLLEAVRKYDDHSDAYRNGGFFFWYDVHARAEAIAHLKDKGAAEKLRKMILNIVEPDGAWVDSHELGRPYGTAMALLSLKRLSPR